MNLGRHLRELSRLRYGVSVCLLLATFAALLVSYEVSFFPPGLQPRSLQMASATTDALVDTPTSVVLDLRQDTSDIDSLTNRAVLLGNVMASAPVRQYIARRAGVHADLIKATTPRTPNAPRPFATRDNKRKASDLLASTDQYRLNIEANPTVPVLKIYSQAPTAKAAAALANGAVDGLRDYLNQIATSQGIDKRTQVRVKQLGRARGAVINGGVSLQATVIVFVLFFFAAAAAAIFISRVRRGFMLADEPEEPWRQAVDAGPLWRSSAGDRDIVTP